MRSRTLSIVVGLTVCGACVFGATAPEKFQAPGPRVFTKQSSLRASPQAPASTEVAPAPAPAPVTRVAPTPPRAAPPPPPPAPSGYGSIPPNARAGECYVQVLVPAQYEEVPERVLVREASRRIETVPPQYEWVEERVVVREASERLEIVPAEYQTLKERVMTKPAAERLIEVPAEYETVTEQVLVKPAHTVWKPGNGLLERVDHTTGEIVCLVEVPAEYKTVSRTVLRRAASTRKETIPAEFAEVERTVMVKPPTTRKIAIPAEYNTVRVQRMVAPAREVVIDIPAEYATVSRQVVRKPAATEWRRVLCETNVTPGLIIDLQNALQREGFYSGPADGILSPMVLDSMERYQRSRSLAVGGITMETLSALKVRAN